MRHRIVAMMAVLAILAPARLLSADCGAGEAHGMPCCAARHDAASEHDCGTMDVSVQAACCCERPDAEGSSLPQVTPATRVEVGSQLAVLVQVTDVSRPRVVSLLLSRPSWPKRGPPASSGTLVAQSILLLC